NRSGCDRRRSWTRAVPLAPRANGPPRWPLLPGASGGPGPRAKEKGLAGPIPTPGCGGRGEPKRWHQCRALRKSVAPKKLRATGRAGDASPRPAGAPAGQVLAEKAGKDGKTPPLGADRQPSPLLELQGIPPG